MLVKDVKKQVRTDRSDCYNVVTNAYLFSDRIETFYLSRSDNYFDLLVKHGPAVAALCRRLSSVRGVDHVTVQTYQVTVFMGGLNSINDEIRKIVNDFIDLSAVLEGAKDKPSSAVLDISGLDNDLLILDLRFELVKKPLNISKKYTESSFKGLTLDRKKFLKSLLAIDGVVQLKVDYYKIEIVCAPLFSKAEIIMKVIDTYTQFA